VYTTRSPTSYNLILTKYKLTYPYKPTVCSHLIIRFDTVVEPETITKLINRHLLCTFRVNAVHINCALSLYAPRCTRLAVRASLYYYYLWYVSFSRCHFTSSRFTCQFFFLPIFLSFSFSFSFSSSFQFISISSS
jgi:hypothetical protein